jgi:hypothetical protein
MKYRRKPVEVEAEKIPNGAYYGVHSVAGYYEVSVAQFERDYEPVPIEEPHTERAQEDKRERRCSWVKATVNEDLLREIYRLTDNGKLGAQDPPRCHAWKVLVPGERGSQWSRPKVPILDPNQECGHLLPCSTHPEGR